MANAALSLRSLIGRGGMQQLGEQQQELCYHFELQGEVYNITVTLTAEHNTVPSG